MTLEEQMAVIENWQAEPPVPVVRIANDLGLRVFRADGWPDDLSGAIRRNDEEDGEYEIFVNGKHAVVRRRFTIAHEIAHYILHCDDIGNGITEDALYRSGLSNKQEAQANRLAADILMPWHLIDPEIEKGITNIVELARTFHVSSSAMSIRLGVPYESNDEQI